MLACLSVISKARTLKLHFLHIFLGIYCNLKVPMQESDCHLVLSHVNLAVPLGSDFFVKGLFTKIPLPASCPRYGLLAENFCPHR